MLTGWYQRYTQWYYSVCAVMYVAKMEDRMKEAKVVQKLSLLACNNNCVLQLFDKRDTI